MRELGLRNLAVYICIVYHIYNPLGTNTIDVFKVMQSHSSLLVDMNLTELPLF
jgi:hypothetical protein